MGPKTTRARKAKPAEDKPETIEEEVFQSKPTRSTRGKAKSDDSETKNKPASKKTKTEESVEENVEKSSPEEEGSGSETSGKLANKKKGTQGKKNEPAKEKVETSKANDNGSESEGLVKSASTKNGRRGKKNEPVKEEVETLKDDENESGSEASDKPSSKKRGRQGKKNKPVQKGEKAPEGDDDQSGSESSSKPDSKKAKSDMNESEEKQLSPSKATTEHVISDDGDSDKESSGQSKPIASPPKKRGRTAVAETSEETNNKKSKAEAVEGSKPKLNQTSSNYGDMKFDSDAQTKDGKKWNFKISSWNVAGLKAWVKKEGVKFIKLENPDIICLQETKCAEKDLPAEAKVPGYHAYWLSGEKKGYAGVALLSKEKPIKVDFGINNEEFDDEGRIITAEYDKFFLVAVYVPNAGQKLKTLPRRMQWDPLLREHIKKLDEKKPVILCGDLNVAHNEIDLANPKTNTKSAGFTPEEREGLSVLLKEGFVDTFRDLYPDKKGAYSFWTYMGNARSRNTGWRLDYFVLSERFVPSVCDNVMRNDVFGSDHCPITLFLHI